MLYYIVLNCIVTHAQDVVFSKMYCKCIFVCDGHLYNSVNDCVRLVRIGLIARRIHRALRWDRQVVTGSDR